MLGERGGPHRGKPHRWPLVAGVARWRLHIYPLTTTLATAGQTIATTYDRERTNIPSLRHGAFHVSFCFLASRTRQARVKNNYNPTSFLAGTRPNTRNPTHRESAHTQTALCESLSTSLYVTKAPQMFVIALSCHMRHLNNPPPTNPCRECNSYYTSHVMPRR